MKYNFARKYSRTPEVMDGREFEVRCGNS